MKIEIHLSGDHDKYKRVSAVTAYNVDGAVEKAMDDSGRFTIKEDEK